MSLEVCLARRESVRRRALEASRDVRRQRRRRRPDADPRTGARGGVAEQLVDLISGRGDVGHWFVAIEREGHADASEHGVCRGLRGERCRVVRPQQQEALDADLLDRQRLVAARGEPRRDAVRMAPWDDRASRDVAKFCAQRVPGGRGRRVAVVDRRVRPLRLAVRSVFER